LIGVVRCGITRITPMELLTGQKQTALSGAVCFCVARLTSAFECGYESSLAVGAAPWFSWRIASSC
jgi:hypothetical protein